MVLNWSKHSLAWPDSQQYHATGPQFYKVEEARGREGGKAERGGGEADKGRMAGGWERSK